MKPIAQAIYDVLAADTTLTSLATGGIHHAPVPIGTPVPCVVIQKITGDREWTLRRAAIRDYTYDVKGITDAGAGTPAEFADRIGIGDQIAERLEALLNDAALNVSGWILMVCRHEAEIDYQEQQASRVLLHRGGSFMIGVTQ